MRALPLSIGTIHFVGIGGIGMSGIAEVLHTLGYAVQGSDIAESANVLRLREAGIQVVIGHEAANLGAAQVVVVSTAVQRDNPEVAAARARLIPVVRRAEMLAELMRLKWSVAVGGTHGKTTTTSLIACVLEAAHLDPTVINGGIINAYGTNTRMGSGDWMVVEADESDGSFLRLPAIIAVVTNMDPEHLDHWGTPEAMIAGYDQFVANIPFYGFAVLCIDHPEVQQMIPRLSDHRIVTYGFSPQADVRAERVVPDKFGSTFEVVVTDRARNRSRRMGPFRLPMLGAHNVQNALAAIAVGIEMEIDDRTLRSAFLGFKGVKRRFTKTGEAGGITVIDDYGHHPVEIAAVLKAARQAGARDVVAVVQPHRYTRLESLFNEFCTCMNDAGTVIVADVYAAGEQPIPGVTRDALVEGLRARGHRSVVALPNPGRLAEMVHAIARPGDFVVCLGAGSITQWAAALPADLAALQAVGGKRSRRWRMMAAPRLPEFVGTLPQLRGRMQADAPLAPFTWFRAGGAAEVLVRPADADDLAGFLRDLPHEVPVHVIGACSNLIVRDGGLPGVTIRLARGFSAIVPEADGIVAGAAALDVTVAEHAAAAGLTGLEFLSGIPGSIGGAVAMNAGAYGGEMADAFSTGPRSSPAAASCGGSTRSRWRSPIATRRCRRVPSSPGFACMACRAPPG